MNQNKFVELVNTIDIEEETYMKTRERENGVRELRINNLKENIAQQTRTITKMN